MPGRGPGRPRIHPVQDRETTNNPGTDTSEKDNVELSKCQSHGFLPPQGQLISFLADALIIPQMITMTTTRRPSSAIVHPGSVESSRIWPAGNILHHGQSHLHGDPSPSMGHRPLSRTVAASHLAPTMCPWSYSLPRRSDKLVLAYRTQMCRSPPW